MRGSRKKQALDAYLVFAPIAMEIPTLSEAKRIAQQEANEAGTPCNIYFRKRWNGQNRDSIVDTIHPKSASDQATTAPMTPPGVLGFFHRAEGGKYHCYDKNQVSLCGEWRLLIDQEGQGFTPRPHFFYRNDCKRCATAYKKAAGVGSDTTAQEGVAA